jgi:nucleotide-binding universal stress UspA family protein
MLLVTSITDDQVGPRENSFRRFSMQGAPIVPILPQVRLKRILCATDFSPGSFTALPVVASIARRYGAKVFVSNVWAPLPYTMVTPEAVNIMEKRQEQAARQKLTEYRQAASTFGISPRLIMKSGDPVVELERVVREQDIDLAVISTHGRVGLKHLTMGSIAEALFRNLSCPVLTVGPHLAHRFSGNVEVRNILFPTDMSEDSRAVLANLASLAKEYDAKLTFLHVLPEETRQNPDARSLGEPLRQEMMRIFCPAISPNCQADFAIEFGDPADAILRRANEMNADLIGFGVRPANDVVLHLRNTVAYRVILDAPCPVLTQRPRRPW